MAKKYLYRVEVRPRVRGSVEPWIGHFDTEREAKNWGEGWSDLFRVTLYRYQKTTFTTRRPSEHKSDPK